MSNPTAMDTTPNDAITIRLCHWDEAQQNAMHVRTLVFVEEQAVPKELERDEFDAQSRHALALTIAGKAVGTGRLLPDGHIGRMAVLADYRATGIGAALLKALIAEAKKQNLHEVVLNAQVRAEGFYARHGFSAEGSIFMDAGIKHRLMRRKL